MLRILRQTEGWVSCVKPAGTDSEAGTPARPGMPQLLSEALNLPAGSVFPVHRLDRETGGMMIYALNRRCAAALSRIIAEGRMEKTYLAVAEGCPEKPSGRFTDLLFWDRAHRRSYPVSRVRKGVKDAALSYRVLSAAENRSLILVAPETGRTHQIRVQFSSRGLPLWGDGRYGGREKGALGLWCAKLSLPDPEGQELLHLAAAPEDTAPWNLFSAELYKEFAAAPGQG